MSSKWSNNENLPFVQSRHTCPVALCVSCSVAGSSPLTRPQLRWPQCCTVLCWKQPQSPDLASARNPCSPYSLKQSKTNLWLFKDPLKLLWSTNIWFLINLLHIMFLEGRFSSARHVFAIPEYSFKVNTTLQRLFIIVQRLAVLSLFHLTFCCIKSRLLPHR